jgi:hypothetical protein
MLVQNGAIVNVAIRTQRQEQPRTTDNSSRGIVAHGTTHPRPTLSKVDSSPSGFLCLPRSRHVKATRADVRLQLLICRQVVAGVLFLQITSR